MTSDYRRNLVLITVECWRGDHFSPEFTPCMAQFGEESAVFTDAHASGGWTLASMTSLMSSTYSSMHGGCRIALRTPERKPLAEILLESGYWTGGFSGNPTCGSGTGFHRGFLDYTDVRRQPPDLPDEAYAHRKDWRALAEMGIPPSAVEKLAYSEQITDMALRWVEARDDGAPWFLWLHYVDSHWPYRSLEQPSAPTELFDAWHDRHLFQTEIHPSEGKLPADAKAGVRWLSRYREGLQITDREIGRLIDSLRVRSDWARTVVAITGDHGEEFHEHGSWQHQWNGLYREGTHVPLMIRIPGAECQRVEQPRSLLDLAPTLLDFAGLKQPASMLGQSLRCSLESGVWPGKLLFSEMMGYPSGSSYRLAVRDEEWKYVYDFDERHRSVLFRLTDDPAETCNLRDARPDVFRRFEQFRLTHITLGLMRLLKRQSAAERYENCDEMAREQLAALGYL